MNLTIKYYFLILKLHVVIQCLVFLLIRVVFIILNFMIYFMDILVIKFMVIQFLMVIVMLIIRHIKFLTDVIINIAF